MNINKSLSLFLFATSLAIGSVQSHAEDWYVGLSYSVLDAELEAAGFTAETEPNGVNAVIGYKINQHIAVEGLVGLGLGDDAVENQNFDFELDNIVGLSAVGTLPLSENFSVYGKLGVAQIEYDDSDGDASEASGALFGVGAMLAITKTIGVNLEYIDYPDGDYDDFDIDVEASAINLGVVIKF